MSSQQPALSTQDWLDLDYLACARDFAYWLAHYAWIKDEQSGELIGPGVALWDGQHAYVDRYLGGEWLIVGKARQLGLSWLATLVDVWELMFKPHTANAVIAQSDEWAMFHLERARWVYEQQPPHIRRSKPLIGSDNKHVLGLSNGSRYLCFPPTFKQVRGLTAHRIRLEELAFWDSPEKCYTAILGAVGDHGQVVIISTGNGEGGMFNEMYIKAQGGKVAFAPMFLSWRVRPGRDDAWYAATLAKSNSLPEMQQEYPDTPEQMFMASGSKYFDLPLLTIRAERLLCAPLRVDMSGCLSVYSECVKGTAYVIGADVADGGGDACAASVKRLDTGETVATYLSYESGADEYGDTLHALGKRYNWAYLGVERNNNGAATLAILLRTQYPNLYYHQHYDPAAAKARPRAGWLTDSNSRPVMLGDYRRVMLDPGACAVHDAETYRQQRAFGYYDGKWQAPKGDHDDLVIAECIAQEMRQVLAGMGTQEIIVYQDGQRIA